MPGAASASARSQSCRRACRWPNDSQRSSSVSCCTRRQRRCTVGFGSTPAAALAVLISSAAARAACNWPAASACSAVCSSPCTCWRAARRLLLRRVDLREPALLDHDQRGLEALRQRGAAHASIERRPARRQIRVVDRRSGRELFRFDHQRFGPGLRRAFALPGCRCGARRPPASTAAAACWKPCAVSPQRGLFGAQRIDRVVAARRQRVQPFAQPALELRARRAARPARGRTAPARRRAPPPSARDGRRRPSRRDLASGGRGRPSR